MKSLNINNLKQKASIYMLIMLLLSLGCPIVAAIALKAPDIDVRKLLSEGGKDYLINLLVLGLISLIVISYRRSKAGDNQSLKSIEVLDYDLPPPSKSPFWFDLIENIFALYLIATVIAGLCVIGIALFF